MTFIRGLVLVISIIVSLLIGHCWHSSSPSTEGPEKGEKQAPASAADEASGKADDEKPAEPTCRVRVTALKRGVLERSVIALGVLTIPAPATHVVSQPMETIAHELRVSVGTAVTPDTVICEVSLTAEAVSIRAQALAARDTARASLTQAKERLALHLATAAEIQQAQQALAQAEPTAAMWEHREDGMQEVRAGMTGVVAKLDIQAGQVVASGAPMAEIAGPQREIRFGCEPGDAARIPVGQAIRVSAPRRPDLPPVTGRVAAISSTLTPETRLQDLIVHLDDTATAFTANLPVGESVAGEIRFPLPEAWIVPRDAVVVEEHEGAVFTVIDGKAVRHPVSLLGSVGSESAVSAEDLKPDDAVIVQGNYEVEDGMRVAVEADH